jgi:hypothetical protein
MFKIQKADAIVPLHPSTILSGIMATTPFLAHSHGGLIIPRFFSYSMFTFGQASRTEGAAYSLRRDVDHVQRGSRHQVENPYLIRITLPDDALKIVMRGADKDDNGSFSLTFERLISSDRSR